MKTFKEHELEESCWPGYKQVGTKKKNGKEVPNCVPEETVDEAPLVMRDMDIVRSILSKLEPVLNKALQKGNIELVNNVARFAGIGVTKDKQKPGKTYRYDLKR